jgi:hypothetical protein
VHIKFWIQNLQKRLLGENRQKYIECMSADTGQGHCERVGSQNRSVNSD